MSGNVNVNDLYFTAPVKWTIQLNCRENNLYIKVHVHYDKGLNTCWYLCAQARLLKASSSSRGGRLSTRWALGNFIHPQKNKKMNSFAANISQVWPKVTPSHIFLSPQHQMCKMSNNLFMNKEIWQKSCTCCQMTLWVFQKIRCFVLWLEFNVTGIHDKHKAILSDVYCKMSSAKPTERKMKK